MVGIEVGPHAEEDAGDRDDDQRDAGGEGEDAPVSTPIRLAVTGSSEVARKARPSCVR